MDKKIIINGSIIHENPTGLGVYALNVIKQLNKKNIEVYCPIEIQGIKVNKISKYVKPSYKKLGAIARLLWTQFVLPFKGDRDAVIYHPFQYLSFFTKRKQIITIHDFIPIYYPVANHQKLYYKYVMPVLLKKADKIICISENTKKDLEKFYSVDKNKVKVIYNGYEESLFNKDIDKEVLEKFNLKNPYMIMVGASYSHKNLDSVIKAFKNIEGNLDLVIIGGNTNYLKELKNLVKEMKLEKKVKFLGYVSDENLKDLYGHSEAFIYPTLYEGFGLPILEAQACGTVVICSNNSSLPEVYKNSAISFDPKNIEDIENSIKKVFEEKELREQLIEKGAENIKRFSWKKTTKEILELI